ncbi:hypothetical protein [Siansivirga zeaxanthinifaciens]|nr:hypothetical protein [Siansivirga zeaxanthinifaciens]
MKNFIGICFLTVAFSSCDPTVSMEANIINQTTQDLAVEFISLDQNLNKTLEISNNNVKRFQEGFDVGNDFIEPYLIEYDSVVVKNSSEQILKVYKPNDSGKNIFKIDAYWISSEPSKNFFKYEYEITSEDLE